jgi:predicted acetyltransferase
MAEISVPRDEADLWAYAEVAARAFAQDPGEARAAIVAAPARRAVVRVAREGGAVVGGALAYATGQLFGGREVPAGAVADVAVAPEARGRGVARALMRDLEDGMRAAGLAVSPLWPSTVALYRRLGWEVAGQAAGHRVPTAALAGRAGAGRARAEPDAGEALRLQRAAAAAWDGPLVRPAWWGSGGPSGPEGIHRYGWEEDGGLTGYLAYAQVGAGADGHGLRVRDLWAATPGARDGLLALLGSHAPVAPATTFAPAVLPWAHDLMWHESAGEVRSSDDGPWMLRLIDPAAAVAARGWPAHARGRVEVAIADPARPAPAPHVLEVEGGEGALSPGGAGTVTLGAGPLAAWYAGALSAVRAGRLGLAEGQVAALAALDALVGRREVWLPERF